MLERRGGSGGAVEAALVEIDEPELAGWADDEVAQVGVTEADPQLEQPLPEFIYLLPQSVAKRCGLFGFAGEIAAECAAFDVRVHQEGIAAQKAPAVLDARHRARRRNAGIGEAVRESPGGSGS